MAETAKMIPPTMGGEIDKRIEIDAPRERVFELLTDFDQRRSWDPNLRAFEPRVGGRFEMTTPADWTFSGAVTEVEPPRLLVYTWACTGHPDGLSEHEQELADRPLTEVRFELEETDAGTSLHLTHGRFAFHEMAEPEVNGWDRGLAALKGTAEK